MSACAWCGCLPSGVGGSAGQHRRACPGIALDSARDLKRVSDDYARALAALVERLDSHQLSAKEGTS